MSEVAARLSSLAGVKAGVRLPRYERDAHGVGIVHIGVGAFHRAHQAVYTDDALAMSGGDWRIDGISLRGTDIADAMQAQNGLFTLLVHSGRGTHARVIGSIANVIAASRDHEAAMAALVRVQTRIVSLSVTEKAYGIDRERAVVMDSHPAIAHDLAHPDRPIGAIGMVVQALRRRRAEGIAPFTVLCCDNLPENGKLLRAGALDFAGRLDPALARWMASSVAFPSCMVDRITPATTSTTLAQARTATGLDDWAAVQTEPFTQWVIEDHFPTGRPDWHLAGALMVKDVAPYEHMKLRMLNGTHSLLAYAGFLSGAVYVRDAMADPHLARLVRRHLAAAAATLQPLADLDANAYAQDLMRRFADPAIAHETYQIAMDGTQKLSQRLLAPAAQCLEQGLPTRAFAFVVAAWMRYCVGRSDTGQPYALRDPREAEITAALAASTPTARALAPALFDLPGLFPPGLRLSASWRNEIIGILDTMLTQGMKAALAMEAESAAIR